MNAANLKFSLSGYLLFPVSMILIAIFIPGYRQQEKEKAYFGRAAHLIPEQPEEQIRPGNGPSLLQISLNNQPDAAGATAEKESNRVPEAYTERRENENTIACLTRTDGSLACSLHL